VCVCVEGEIAYSLYSPGTISPPPPFNENEKCG